MVQTQHRRFLLIVGVASEGNCVPVQERKDDVDYSIPGVVTGNRYGRLLVVNSSRPVGLPRSKRGRMQHPCLFFFPVSSLLALQLVSRANKNYHLMVPDMITGG